MSITRTARRVGVVCLLLSAVLWSLSFPLHCAARAALVGGCGLLDGVLFGLCLALVTRTRRPLGIYLGLGLAALTFWPLWESWPLHRGWPIGDPGRIVPWNDAPDLVYSYFDLLRGTLFVLGMPAPFARYGQHCPDPLPTPIEGIELGVSNQGIEQRQNEIPNEAKTDRLMMVTLIEKPATEHAEQQTKET